MRNMAQYKSHSTAKSTEWNEKSLVLQNTETERDKETWRKWTTKRWTLRLVIQSNLLHNNPMGNWIMTKHIKHMCVRERESYLYILAKLLKF